MFDTPMRYPGGKGRLATGVIDIIKLNCLTGGDYVEPYAGGAGIAITLLYLEYASRIHLNDLNRSVHARSGNLCATSLTRCANWVLDKLPTLAQRKKQKAIQTDKDASTLESVFYTLSQPHKSFGDFIRRRYWRE